MAQLKSVPVNEGKEWILSQPGILYHWDEYGDAGGGHGYRIISVVIEDKKTQWGLSVYEYNTLNACTKYYHHSKLEGVDPKKMDDV